MCGLVGIYHKKDQVSADIYDGLVQVQHRGQDAAGIATWDKSKMYTHKELGLVSEVFKTSDSLINLNGNMGIGHVRYPTAGCDDVSEAQQWTPPRERGATHISAPHALRADDLARN